MTRNPANTIHMALGFTAAYLMQTYVAPLTISHVAGWWVGAILIAVIELVLLAFDK